MRMQKVTNIVVYKIFTKSTFVLTLAILLKAMQLAVGGAAMHYMRA